MMLEHCEIDFISFHLIDNRYDVFPSVNKLDLVYTYIKYAKYPWFYTDINGTDRMDQHLGVKIYSAHFMTKHKNIAASEIPSPVYLSHEMENTFRLTDHKL